MMIPRKSAKKMAKNWSKRPKICKKIKLTSMTIPRKSVKKSVKNLNVSAKINLSKNWSKIGRKSAKKLRRSFEKRCYRKKKENNLHLPKTVPENWVSKQSFFVLILTTA